MANWAFFPRVGHAVLAVPRGIFWLLDASKSCFNGQPLNFICT
jgi:hypothetical protein